MRLATALVAGAALAVAAAGCSTGPLTSAHLDRSVSATFANLWVYHEVELGHPRLDPGALQVTATCQKGLPTAVQHGAGADWLCHVTWLAGATSSDMVAQVFGGTPITATYTLDVQTDGCYAADGDGPASVNGSPVITAAAGSSRVNPVYHFNGCIDTA